MRRFGYGNKKRVRNKQLLWARVEVWTPGVFPGRLDRASKNLEAIGQAA
jgi:hypothetical protein